MRGPGGAAPQKHLGGESLPMDFEDVPTAARGSIPRPRTIIEEVQKP